MSRTSPTGAHEGAPENERSPRSRRSRQTQCRQGKVVRALERRLWPLDPTHLRRLAVGKGQGGVGIGFRSSPASTM